MIGLPHSSQKTRFLGRLAVCRRMSSIAACISAITSLATLARSDAAGDQSDIGIDIFERARRKAKKANAGLKNLDDGRLLVGNCGDHKVGLERRESRLAFDVHESAIMLTCRWPLRASPCNSGTTSKQYFVQATTRSNSPMLARMTVALGCRQAMRRGARKSGIFQL